MRRLATLIDTAPLIGQFNAMDAAWAQRSCEGVRFVPTRWGAVRIREQGGGPVTVVLAADPPNIVEHYDELLEALAPWARAVCLELPGFGFSRPRLGFPFTIEATSDAVGDVLRHLGAGPCVLAFPCITGFVALQLAATEPHLVSFVSLQQTPCWADMVRWSHRVDPHGRLATPALGQALMRVGRVRVAEGWYRAASGSDVVRARLWQRSREAFAHGAGYSLASLFQCFAHGSLEFHNIVAPAQVVWGALDRTHRDSDCAGARAYLPGATFVTYRESGHFPELELPQRFAADLRQALLAHGLLA